MKLAELKDVTNDLTDFEAFKKVIGKINSPSVLSKIPVTWKTHWFITKAKKVHNNKYNYSNVNYINAHARVVITCSVHGDFEQIPNNHLQGMGCNKCGGSEKKTPEQFIRDAVKVHNNKYGYSKTIYKNFTTKVIIVCPKHGDYHQLPSNHLAGKGCRKCATDASSKSIDEFIQESHKVHENKYDYFKTVYVNGTTKVVITCKTHGDFKQTPKEHVKGIGCPSCKESKGEERIRLWLDKNSIDYVREHKFPNLPKLRFDFYLPDHNTTIEFDGIQHFISVKRWGGEKGLKKRQELDEIKNQFCVDNNTKLIRIPYTEYNKIPLILKKEIL